MKNILIICIQGLTSSIMAKKLTDYAAQKREAYFFKATSYKDIENYREWADIVLLTPQIKSYAEQIQAAIDGYDCDMKLLLDTTISLGSTEDTYENIKKFLIPDKDKIQFGEIIKCVVCDAVFGGIIIAAACFLFELFCRMLGFPMPHKGYMVSTSCVGVFLAYYMGSRLGQYGRCPVLTYGMVGAMTQLLITSIYYMRKFGDSGDYSTRNVLLTDTLGYQWLWMPVILLLLFVFYGISELFYRYYEKKKYIVFGYFCLPNIMSVICFLWILFILSLILCRF